MATTQAKLWQLALGTSYAGFKVYHYTAGTTTTLDVYRDAGKTTTDTQPVQADANGFVSFYGDGNYRLKITTSSDILLWDLSDVDISGGIVGTNTYIPFFNSSGALTEDARFTYDPINNRFGLGTSTNITEKAVLPFGYLGIVRNGANANESARGAIGLDSSDRVVIDREGMGIVMPAATQYGIPYFDANGQLQWIHLTNGQLLIGSSNAAPVGAQPIVSGGLTYTPGAGSGAFASTTGRLYARTTASLAISNTTTETTLWSFNLLGGDFDITHALFVNINGTYVNSSGATKTLQIKINLGGSTVFDDVTPTIASSANSRAYELSFLLLSRTANDTADISGSFNLSAALAATAGSGGISSNNLVNGNIRAIQTSAGFGDDKLIDVTVIHSAAASTVTINRIGACAVLF